MLICSGVLQSMLCRPGLLLQVFAAFISFPCGGTGSRNSQQRKDSIKKESWNLHSQMLRRCRFWKPSGAWRILTGCLVLPHHPLQILIVQIWHLELPGRISESLMLCGRATTRVSQESQAIFHTRCSARPSVAQKLIIFFLISIFRTKTKNVFRI